jgi:hypothetical protein
LRLGATGSGYGGSNRMTAKEAILAVLAERQLGRTVDALLPWSQPERYELYSLVEMLDPVLTSAMVLAGSGPARWDTTGPQGPRRVTPSYHRWPRRRNALGAAVIRARGSTRYRWPGTIRNEPRWKSSRAESMTEGDTRRWTLRPCGSRRMISYEAGYRRQRLPRGDARPGSPADCPTAWKVRQYRPILAGFTGGTTCRSGPPLVPPAVAP